MKNLKENTLGNYLFDINILDEMYITLTKEKIKINGANYRNYTDDVREIENTKYTIVTYTVNSKTVLTILEHGTILNSQFLITSDGIFEDLKIEDLTEYVSNEVADLVIRYFR